MNIYSGKDRHGFHALSLCIFGLEKERNIGELCKGVNANNFERPELRRIFLSLEARHRRREAINFEKLYLSASNDRLAQEAMLEMATKGSRTLGIAYFLSKMAEDHINDLHRF